MPMIYISQVMSEKLYELNNSYDDIVVITIEVVDVGCVENGCR